MLININQKWDGDRKLSYIDSNKEFDDFIKRASKSEVIAIDTEFLREKTYYPNLCLLQFATESEVAIVDPFAVDDISALAALLEDDRVKKLFHAATQDLEILNHEVGVVPKNVFDVQIAAALLGSTHQAGLGSLVSSYLGISIKKSDSFTDWTRRPLADSQLQYAAEDVVYLPGLYREMTKRLASKGRLKWLEGEFEKLTDPRNFEEHPHERFRRLKRGNQLSRRQMAAARDLAAWREVEAMDRDLPRKWILTDEQIVEACKREAKTLDDLFMVRGLKQSLSMRDARRIVELIKKAVSSPESTWPKPEVPQSSEVNVDSAVDLMEALMRVRAKENSIAMHLIASRSDLSLVARGHLDEAEVMRGWRYEVVGKDLLDLLNGTLSLGLKDNELVVFSNKPL